MTPDYRRVSPARAAFRVARVCSVLAAGTARAVIPGNFEIIAPSVATQGQLVHVTFRTDWGSEGFSLYANGLAFSQGWWDHCNNNTADTCILQTNKYCPGIWPYGHDCAYSGGEWSMRYRGPPHLYYLVTDCRTSSLYCTFLGPSHEGPFYSATNRILVRAPPRDVIRVNGADAGSVCVNEEVLLSHLQLCGRPTSWVWNFDDDHVGWGESTKHTYATQGVYEVLLLTQNETGHCITTKTLTVRADCFQADGYVYRTGTREGIPNATLRITPQAAGAGTMVRCTDDSGYYRFSLPDEGTCSIDITHPHYVARTFPTASYTRARPRVDFFLVERESDERTDEDGVRETVSGDPVHPATGNFVFWKTFLVLPGRELPFHFTVYYNSRAHAVESPLGPGWSHSYQVRLTTGPPGRVTLRLEDGREIPFVRNPGGGYEATNALTFIRLAALPGGGHQATLHTGTIYLFDAEGRLAEIRTPAGNRLTFAYAPHLYRVTDTSGRAITFSYAGNRLKSLVTPASAGATLAFTHDPDGNLAGIRDAEGHALAFNYDGEHRLLAHWDANGNRVVANTYDAEGRVATQSDALGTPTTWSYETNALGIHSRITVGDSEPVDYQFDRGLNLVAITSGDSAVLAGYSARGLREIWQDARGGQRRYTYDASGNLTRWADRTGHATEIAYGPDNRPRQVRDSAGGEMSFDWTAAGGLAAITDGSGRTVAATHTPDGLPETITDRRQGVWRRTYRADGLAASVADPLGNVWLYDYDDAGRLTRITRPNGLAAQTYTYNLRGQILAATDPLGVVAQRRYDANGNLTGFSVPSLGAEEHYTYDARNRCTAMIGAEGGTNRLAYDALGNLQTLTDADGVALNYLYDTRSRLVARRDALGHETRYHPDVAGSVTALVSAAGACWRYTRDAEGRPLAIQAPGGGVTRFTYDGAGRAIAVTDPLHRTTARTFNYLGQVSSLLHADGSMRRHEYDASGFLREFIDAQGRTWRFTRDACNRVTRVTDPLGASESFQYDACGNLVRAVTRNGAVIDLARDLRGDLLQLAAPEGIDLRFTRDARGQVVRAAAGAAETQITHDRAGRRIRCENADGLALAFAYTPAGRLASVTYPGDRTVRYRYDAAGRLDRVTDWLGHETRLERDPEGRVTRLILPNQTRRTYAYDAGGWLAALGHESPEGACWLSLALARDADGAITNVAGLGTLAPDGPASDETYFEYDGANRLLLMAGAAEMWDFDHDANGNLVAARGIGITNSLVFDPLNTLVAVSNAAHLTTYGYDALGNRCRVRHDGAESRYLCDRGRNYGRYAPSGDLEEYHVYGGPLLYTILSNGALRVYHEDERGSVLAVTDARGNVIQRYAYDAYGAIAAASGTPDNAFCYLGTRGVMLDPDGLHCMGARYYDARFRRFLSEDPLHLAAGANLYAYVDGDPVNRVDPKGLKPDPTDYGFQPGVHNPHPNSTYSDGLPVRFWDNDLTPVENRQINEDLEAVYQTLDARGRGLTFINYAANGSCVDASRDRGVLLREVLPDYWHVESRSYGGKVVEGGNDYSPHTFNMIKFTDSKGQDHYFHVDNYCYPIWISEQTDWGLLDTRNLSYRNRINPVYPATEPFVERFDGLEELKAVTYIGD